VTSGTAASIFKKAREHKALTQIDVAQEAGIHINTYARIERGDQIPTFQTIKKVAKVLELNVADIPD